MIFSKSLSCFSMLLIFCLVVCSFANTSLFSSCLTCIFALSFYSFSKSPCTLWTKLSFYFMICLFLISILEILSRMLIICVLYYTICWNIMATLLCSSSFASNHCIDPSVWNLGVCPLELVSKQPRLLCEVQIFPKMFVHVAKLGLEGSIRS